MWSRMRSVNYSRMKYIHCSKWYYSVFSDVIFLKETQQKLQGNNIDNWWHKSGRNSCFYIFYPYPYNYTNQIRIRRGHVRWVKSDRGIRKVLQVVELSYLRTHGFLYLKKGWFSFYYINLHIFDFICFYCLLWPETLTYGTPIGILASQPLPWW